MRKHQLIYIPFVLGVAALTAFGLKPRVAVADAVQDAETARVKLIQKVKPAVVAVFMKEFQSSPEGKIAGGGSGVIIDEEGYCLTNFHVVDGGASLTPTFACGLPNGQIYDAVVVGVDKVGDTALIKLFPKTKDEKFPFAELGNSDELKPGDWTLNMGNAQLLSTDFTPSVSFGLVSGVNRYADFGFAEHTDAIQYDTTANQGNSGGPIFNMKGQVVGLVFGGAPGKRGAFNTGIGYGLPINMAKNFLGHMRAGIFCDHATLGATVNTEANEDSLISKLVVNQVLPQSDAERRGLSEGDVLLNFAGRPLTSANQFKSALGIFPKEWRMPLTYQRGNDKKETLVRLMSYTPQVVQKKDGQAPNQGPAPKPKAFGEGVKVYEERKGFANFYFNRKSRDRLLEETKKVADYSVLTGDWSWVGSYEGDNRSGDFLIKVEEVKEADGKDTKPVATILLGQTSYKLEPQAIGLTTADLTEPPFSGGLLAAMYQYRRFLVLGAKGSERDGCVHGGVEPIYIMPADGSQPKKFEDHRLMAEVIKSDHAAVKAKWFFYKKALNPTAKVDYPEGALIAAEVQVDPDADPCELYFSDFREVNGKRVPHRMEVRVGDKRYAVFTVKQHLMK
jgi:serine protease Do